MSHKDMVELRHNSSPREMQSEMGVTGEWSPNLELFTQASVLIGDAFKHEPGTISANDAFIFFTDSHLGVRLDKPGDHRSTHMLTGGTPEAQIAMLTKAMIRCPGLITIFSCALSNAIIATQPGMDRGTWKEQKPDGE